jgi:hypothetical protein
MANFWRCAASRKRKWSGDIWAGRCSVQMKNNSPIVICVEIRGSSVEGYHSYSAGLHSVLDVKGWSYASSKFLRPNVIWHHFLFIHSFVCFVIIFAVCWTYMYPPYIAARVSNLAFQSRETWLNRTFYLFFNVVSSTAKTSGRCVQILIDRLSFSFCVWPKLRRAMIIVRCSFPSNGGMKPQKRWFIAPIFCAGYSRTRMRWEVKTKIVLADAAIAAFVFVYRSCCTKTQAEQLRMRS